MDSYETNVSFSPDVSGFLGARTAVLVREERQRPSGPRRREGGTRRDWPLGAGATATAHARVAAT